MASFPHLQSVHLRCLLPAALFLFSVPSFLSFSSWPTPHLADAATRHSLWSCYVVIIVHFSKSSCLCLPCFALSCSTWWFWTISTGCNHVQTQGTIYWELDKVRTAVLHHRCDLICHHTQKAPQKTCKVTDVRVSQTYCLGNCKSSFTRQ